MISGQRQTAGFVEGIQWTGPQKGGQLEKSLTETGTSGGFVEELQ